MFICLFAFPLRLCVKLFLLYLYLMNPKKYIISLAFLALTTNAFCGEDSCYYFAKNKLYNELVAYLKITRPNYALYVAVSRSAFNQPEYSNAVLEHIDVHLIPDSLKFLYYSAQYDNYLNLYEYAKAANTGGILLKDFKNYYTAETYSSLEEDVNVWETVSEAPPQTMEKKGGAVIPLAHDKYGLQRVQVKIADSAYDFVFDTGASISVATESFAKKLGIKMLSQKLITTKAIAGNEVSGRMGLLDNLSVSSISAHHVLFYVFPDSVLSFGGGVFKIDAILGFPVIKAFGTFTQTHTQISVAASDSVQESSHHNFTVQDQVPVIYLKVFDKELPFAFDTGDNDILLSKTFYDAFQPKIRGRLKTGGVAGAGGGTKFKAFVIDSLTLSVGDKPALFKNISVNTENYHISGKEYYGNVGQALITKFKSMTISFTNAAISFD
jgi:predicted aspartyl protease